MISLAAPVTAGAPSEDPNSETEVTLAALATFSERAIHLGNCKIEECSEVTLQRFPSL